MQPTWPTALWHQFGAAIDFLDDTLAACPDARWEENLYIPAEAPRYTVFWYLAYHTLFWLDFYLSDDAEGYTAPDPFTMSELDWGGYPPRVYTKAELREFLAASREKCRQRLEDPEGLLAPQRSRDDWPEMTVAEMMIYNMRHVQEHGAQLSLFLAQKEGEGPGWVSKAR